MRALRFDLGPFPVTVEPTFLLLAVFLALSGMSIGVTVAFTVIAFVSVLAHELAHAVAFRRFGCPSTITLHAFGGVTSPSGGTLTHGQSAVTSLAGPLVGVAIGVPLLILNVPGLVGDLLFLAAIVNLTWAVFNLLPILPLDGGQAFRALLGTLWPGAADPISLGTSLVVAIVVATWAVMNGWLFAGIFTAYFGMMNLKDLGKLRDRKLIPAVREAAARLEAGDAEGAIAIASGVLGERSVSAELRAIATSITAWALLESARDQEASTTVNAFDHEHPPSDALRAAVDLVAGAPARGIERLAGVLHDAPVGAPATLGRVLVRSGQSQPALDRLREIAEPVQRRTALAQLQVLLHIGGAYADAAQLGTELFDAEPDPWVAYNLACSCVRGDRPDDAIAWLDQAARKGFDAMEAIDGDPDLFSLRADPRFAAVREQIARNATATR